MNKRQYLGLLLKQSPEWIRQSMNNPTEYMRPIHIKLHALALRNWGK